MAAGSTREPTVPSEKVGNWGSGTAHNRMTGTLRRDGKRLKAKLTCVSVPSPSDGYHGAAVYNLQGQRLTIAVWSDTSH